jgi:hypothetical protein
MFIRFQGQGRLQEVSLILKSIFTLLQQVHEVGGIQFMEFTTFMARSMKKESFQGHLILTKEYLPST